MLTGTPLPNLLPELSRRAQAAKDYVAPAGRLRFTLEQPTGVEGAEARPEVALSGLNGGPLALTRHAHTQVAEYLGIPLRYYDRMAAEEPTLLLANANRWLERAGNEQRLVRTLDHRVRAVLSDRYRPLDNMDLLEAVVPTLQRVGAKVVSSQVTDLRLYVETVLEEREGEVKPGDVVRAGIAISNSEVGAGSLRIEPLLYRLVCRNGLIAKESRLRAFHLGGAAGGDSEGVRSFMRNETRQAADRAFFLKVRDVVEATFAGDLFAGMLDAARQAAGQPIERPLSEVVEVTTQRLALPEGLREPILETLARDGDLSRWGLVNAVTAQAHRSEQYEQNIDLQRAGGSILEWTAAEWSKVAAN